ncbi:hypothetical protein EON64_04410 [archaeon]|nr:MAG: hypothetical protein EON64_04410 [archaeon]
MFRLKPSSKDRAQVVNLYRSVMRVVKQLEPSHQRLWYEYTRLKFAENQSKNSQEVKKLIKNAYEELDWVKSVIARKAS